MRSTSRRRTWHLVLLGSLALASACSDNLDGGSAETPEGSGLCDADSVNVTGMIVHDARDGDVKDSAFINLNDGANPEYPLNCDATVVLIVGSTTTTLQETRQSQYEAGYSEIVPDLPPLTLTPGSQAELEIDLGSDGSVDVTGVVRLSDVTGFRTTSSAPGQVTFAWNDSGEVGNTTYSVQACDEQDFVFPDNFATGYVEGSTTIQFGGSSEWRYFESSRPHYARIQADTQGSLSSPGRFTAWDWPTEPILQY